MNEDQNQTVTLRDLTRGNPEFCEDDCFGLVLATKSLDKTASSLYGLALSNSKGDILYKRYFGQDVPDSALGFDRLGRFIVDESVGIVEAISDMLPLLPKGAKLFSSHARTWATVIWKDMIEAYPMLAWDESIVHVDIREFAKSVELNKIPNPTSGIMDYCSHVGTRVSLFEVCNRYGVRDALTKPAPESKSIAIGLMIGILFGTQIKIPK
jgi:hypothetical protein